MMVVSRKNTCEIAWHSKFELQSWTSPLFDGPPWKNKCQAHCGYSDLGVWQVFSLNENNEPITSREKRTDSIYCHDNIQVSRKNKNFLKLLSPTMTLPSLEFGGGIYCISKKIYIYIHILILHDEMCQHLEDLHFQWTSNLIPSKQVYIIKLCMNKRSIETAS